MKKREKRNNGTGSHSFIGILISVLCEILSYHFLLVVIFFGATGCWIVIPNYLVYYAFIRSYVDKLCPPGVPDDASESG